MEKTQTQKENIPSKTEKEMVLDVAKKSKEIMESIVKGSEELEETGRYYIDCMAKGNTQDAVRIARHMCIRAELADALKARIAREDRANNRVYAEHANPINEYRDVIPSEEMINDLLKRYTDSLAPSQNNPDVIKLMELKEAVHPYWEALKK